jgi:hypothetical protein
MSAGPARFFYCGGSRSPMPQRAEGGKCSRPAQEISGRTSSLWFNARQGCQRKGRCELGRGGGFERLQVDDRDFQAHQLDRRPRVRQPFDLLITHEVSDQDNFSFCCRGNFQDAKPSDFELSAQLGRRLGKERGALSRQYDLIVSDELHHFSDER